MLVARAGLSPVMVGRASDLARLRQLLRAGAEPRVALIRGEAGVGKTRLVKELVTGLPPAVTVLSAQAEQGAMGRPYELLLEAVAPSVAGWTRVPGPLRRWEDALGVLLGPIAPQLGAADRGYAADELARAAIELVRHVVGGGAGLVVFEDLHWADAETLGLFQRLAVTPGLPVVLVGSYRPEDLDRHHVTDLVAAIERQRQVTHVVLDRLSVDEVGRFVASVREADVTYATAAALHRRTGGNPFFLEELLVAAGDAPVDSLADLPLPVTLTEAVLRHLEGLDAEQRQVVDAAAVLGQRIPFDRLASVTGLGEEMLVQVLRDLVGRGLVVEDETDVFSFRHALTREAVAGRLLGRERRRLHEKSLASLQEAGSDDWAALAYHAGGAGRWEEMVAAARAGAAYYLRCGATYQALRLAEMALHEADADLELLELATRSAWAVGLPADAMARAEQWRRLAEQSSDPADLTRALRVVARLRWEAGEAEAHQVAVEAARRAAEQLDRGEERAWVANLLAESAMLNRRPVEAVEWADEALALAGPSVDGRLEAAVLVNKGSALLAIDGREAEGQALLVEAISAAVAVEDFQSALRGTSNLAHAVFPRWPPEPAAALLDQMGELIERSGRQDWTGSRHRLRAIFLAHVMGDLTGARAELERSVTPDNKGTWATLIRAELALEAGQEAEAEAILSTAEVAARSSGTDPEDRAHVIALAARLAARRRQVDEAARLLWALAEFRAAQPHLRALLSDAWHHAMVASLRAGLDPGEAVRLVATTETFDPSGDHESDAAWPDHLAGALAEARGRTEEAWRFYEAAATDRGWRRSPPAAADAHLGAARALLALDRVADARRHALAAEALLERWPGWRQDDARALLRRLGQAAEGSAPAGLTAREEEVAVLLAEGLTNGEIAARLYISTKTASVHVSNILRKLGMGTRSEVAAWAVREGLSA